MPYSPNIAPDHTTLAPTTGVALPAPVVENVSIALTPAIVNTITTNEQIFAVAGVAATDKVVYVNKPTTQAGLILGSARVSSAGNVALTFGNPTAGGLTPTAAEVYQIGILKS